MRDSRARHRPTALLNNPVDILSTDFPLKSRIAKYALKFLSIKNPPVGRYLIEMIMSVVSKGESYAIAERLQTRFQGTPGATTLMEQVAEAEDEDDLSRAFHRFINIYTSKESQAFQHEVVPLLEGSVRKDTVSYGRRRDELCRKLDLDKEKYALIELACCYNLSSGLEHLMDSYDMTRKSGLFAFLTETPRSRIGRLIAKNSKLAVSDFLQVDERCFNLNSSIYDYLIGNAGKDFAVDAFKVAGKASIPLDAVELKPAQRDTLIRLLNSSEAVNILFHGKAGTGKTELSKALAEYCGREAVFVSYGDDGDARDRRIELTTTINSVSKETVVIVDEVDALLNTDQLFRENKVNKGWVNQFLDSSRHAIIWITNKTSDIEESVRRRFAYNIWFKPLTWQQRSTIWNTQLRKNRIKRFFKTQDIQQLARRFPVSPGLIAYATKTLSMCLVQDMSLTEVHGTLDEILTRQMELTEGTTPEKKLNTINAHYDLDALHTDLDPTRLIQGVENWQQSENEFGVSLLFWGWPGTGKTEFAKYMADQLGKELMVKRMSDLQSMYVGQTEKQIAHAFHEAEENDAILFLDEADSLFIDRQTAHRSWESSQTNEVLTQMENFQGILICCTNLLDHLDEAAMRRFAFKIKFLPLTPDGILRLYRQYFASIKESLSPELEARLRNIRNLCPGDIKAVWQRTRFMGDTLSHAEVIQELEREVGYKVGCSKAPIGFS